MKDSIGGSALGAVASKLLDEVLDALKDLKDRDDNLQEFELLLQRLQPFVREVLDFTQDETVHPARLWLGHLQDQLEPARALIQDCSKVKMHMGVTRRLRSLKTLVILYDSMCRLLSEASTAQWATGLPSINNLRKDLEDARNDRAKMMAKLEKLEQWMLEISEAVKFEPSNFRTSQIKRTASKQIFAIHTQNNALPSSLSSSSASSSSNPLREKHWNRDSGTSAPTVSFGGDTVARQLISDLVSGRYRKWLGLWGAGGAGKTFTARKIYNDDAISKYFLSGRFWVTISQEQPSIHVLLKKLFECIGGEGKFPDALEDASNLLRRWLDRDKVLLILDDLWDPSTLKQLDLISEGRGVILVTTRDRNNLINAVDSDNIIQIPRLSQEDSWKLFSWHAFLAHRKDVLPELEVIARAVADECRGLPLVLQVIGSTMAGLNLSDREVRHLGPNNSLRQEWEVALDKLRTANVAQRGDETLYRQLQLSVDYLGEEDPRLQDCFVYFAAFPEDDEVDMELLVSIWIAEGMVGNEEEDLAYREREGRALIALLVSKSIIELIELIDTNGRRNVCKMHDVIRDLAHRNLKWKVAKEQQWAEAPPTERVCLYAPGLKSEVFPEEWTASGTRYYVERLSFHTNLLERLPDQFNAQDLRVLILTANIRLRTLSPTFFMSLSQLTVLELSITNIEEISGAIFRSLKSLVLLNLSECERLKKISNGIGELENLQFLILYKCINLQNLPRMKSLTKLHTLAVPQRDGTTFSSKLLGYRDFRQVLQLRNLKRLQIDLCGWRQQAFFDVSALVSLERLEMKDAAFFPRGMSKLQSLKTLHVALKLFGSSVPALQKLPRLEDLMISASCPLVMRKKAKVLQVSMPESFGHTGAFPSLKSMKLLDVSIHESFAFHDGAMPNIQRLTIIFKTISKGMSVWVPPTLSVLGGSLNFLRVVGCDADHLDLVFRDPSKFPNLEYLDLKTWPGLSRTIGTLPRLRWLHSEISEKEKWPENLEQLEKQGKVTVDVGWDSIRKWTL